VALHEVCLPGSSITVEDFLAGTYSSDIQRPVYQQKVDGVRCNLVRQSPENLYLEFPTAVWSGSTIVPHIQEALETHLPWSDFGQLILDGEMFDCQVGRPSVHIGPDEEKVERWRFAAFDVIGMEYGGGCISEIPLKDRLALLEFSLPLHSGCNTSHTAVKYPLSVVRGLNRSEAEDLLLVDGVEGLVVKNELMSHVAGRSKQWMKVKKWLTVDLEVCDVVDKNHVRATFVTGYGLKKHKVKVPALDMIMILGELSKDKKPVIECRALHHKTTNTYNMLFERIRWDKSGWDCNSGMLDPDYNTLSYDG
jgi:hypothetical protein